MKPPWGKARIGAITTLGAATFAIVAAALLTVSRAQLAISPWPMFHHDAAHTGQSPVDTSANTGTLKWKFATSNDVFSSPAVGTDGTIYVGGSGPGVSGNLSAIKPGGALKWKLPITIGDQLSSPAIGADGTIFVGSSYLYAAKPDGKLKWKFVGDYGFGESSPAIGADGTIYVDSIACGDDSCTFVVGYVYAVSPDGKQKWKFLAGGAIVSSPAVGSDGTIYFVDQEYDTTTASSSTNLYAINANGKRKWKFPTGDGDVEYSSPAIGADGTIYVGGDDDFGYGILYAVNPDGTLKWPFAAVNLAANSSPAIGADGTIYFADTDNLYAVNPDDGSQKWAFTVGGYDSIDQSSPAIGADGTVYVGTIACGDDSCTFAVGHLYAVNSDGTQKWKFGAGGIVESSPAIGADGTIYVDSLDGNLYAIGGSGTPTATPTGATPTSTPTGIAPTSTSTGTTPTSTLTPTPTASATPAPRPLLLGASFPDSTEISTFQTESNRHLDIINTYVPWVQCDGSATTFVQVWSNYSGGTIDANNSEVMITWIPGSDSGCTSPIEICPAAIAAGDEDGVIAQLAQAIAEYNKPIFIRPMHEMNLGGKNSNSWAIGNPKCKTTNKNFVSAWQHIVNIFTEQGATNAQFVWCINNANAGKGTFTGAYPGDGYVSYVSIDGYNWGSGSGHTWQTFKQVFKSPYKALSGLTSKRILISEWASAEATGKKPVQTKADWITQAFGALESGEFSQISGLLWFDYDKERDWQIESSPAAEAAYRSAVEVISCP